MPTIRDSAGPDDADARPIDLARAAPFALAHATVTPAARRIEVGGWSRRLEPRAMQVLVVLARARPAVVGRGELNARVWGGRVVGEDAINRAVQMLRRIAADAPPPAPFGIETIPRVGYRLTVGDGRAAAPAPDAGHGAELSPARPARRRRRLVAVVLAVAAIPVAIASWTGWRPHRQAAADWRIAGSAALDDLPPEASDATLSPDGQRLAYRRRDPAGHERVFVRPAAGGGIDRPISPSDFDARRPAWSPDGTAIAFARYEAGRPCRLYVVRADGPAAAAGGCETARDPRLSWSADGASLMFGDAPGENAVSRIRAVRIADGLRTVLSNPPGDSRGDDLPIARGGDLVFRRGFAWGDEGWIARDMATGRERLLWRRRGVSGSVAAALGDGALAIAWARAGAAGLDVASADGRVTSQPVAPGAVTALSAAGARLLVEFDRRETELIRADGGAALAKVRGWIAGFVLLSDGRLRFPVTSGGSTRIWERDPGGALRLWGSFAATRIVALTPSPDERFTAGLAIGSPRSEIVLFDAAGTPVRRWHPPTRALPPMAWSSDGRRLIVPILDAAGWRLIALDPFTGKPPRDLGLPGFAVVKSRGAALYAVRAGETTGIRELWRLDGGVRRLPIDLTLFDIVNWCLVDAGVWLPDRSDRDHPRLVLRDPATGRVVRSVAAPDLAGPSSGLAADATGPIYARTTRDAPEYGLLTLARTQRD